MPAPKQKPILVAAIAGAFGVRGEVRLKSFTEDPATCLSYAPFVDEEGREILHITSSRKIKDGFAVFTDEIKTCEEAQAKKSTKLYAFRERFAEPDEGDFYQADLVGLCVEDEDGQSLGRIKAVLNFGASDLLEITGILGKEQSWTIPFSLYHVPVVDIDGGKVVLHEAKTFFADDADEPVDNGEQA